MQWGYPEGHLNPYRQNYDINIIDNGDQARLGQEAIGEPDNPALTGSDHWRGITTSLSHQGQLSQKLAKGCHPWRHRRSVF